MSFQSYIDAHQLYGKHDYQSMNFRCKQIFSKIKGLDGKLILDIGGGEGLISLWVLEHGASKALILEPEVDGSSNGVVNKFNQHLQYNPQFQGRAELLPDTFQKYEPGENEQFDIILLYNSINHLDENACINLQSSSNAKQLYREFIRKLYKLLKPSGNLIISDAGRINYWDCIGLKSPVAPDIEWEKHQEPEYWIRLCGECGFKCIGTMWYVPHQLRFIKWLLSKNKILARLTTSCFIITFEKV